MVAQLEPARRARRGSEIDAGGAQAASDSDLQRIEAAVSIIARFVTLPSTWAAMFERAGVSLPPGVDRSAYPLLGRIARMGPIRLTAIANQMGVRASTVSRQLAELERHGLVERSVDPTDARASVFTLGERGRALLDRLRAVRHEGMAERLQGWDPRDVAAFADLLNRFAASLAPQLCDPLECGEPSRSKGAAR